MIMTFPPMRKLSLIMSVPASMFRLSEYAAQWVCAIIRNSLPPTRSYENSRMTRLRSFCQFLTGYLIRSRPSMVLRREEELGRFEIPLLNDREDVNGVIKNGVRHHFIREWALHQPREIKLLHSMREVTRHLRAKYDTPGNYTVREIQQVYSIQFLQFACTAEDVRFEWL